MNKLLEKNSKSISIFILFIFIFILFFGGLIYFCGDKYKSKKALNSTFSNINSINKSLSSSIKDTTIDTEKASFLVEDCIKELNDLKATLININESSLKNPNVKKYLSASIDDTLLLYNYLFNSLSSPKDVINNESLDNFYKLIENCTLSYKKVSSHNSKEVKFSKETFVFFNNYHNYLNSLIKINRDFEFLSKQNREFLMKLEGFTTSIDTLNKDFSLAINKVREDKRDLSVVIDDIYLKEELFEDLKKNAFSLSVPDGYLNVYNNLFDYINYYEIYITAIKNAAIYEKTCSDVDKYSKEINKNYNNAYSKREDVLSSYEDFVLTIKNN
ncbi:hypothetical protein [Clostridium sp.]|uniref:hypothetical protein n=1 Tax=Clostridium sp. TaxID=1506 RepID=UPI0026225EA3|nr:hypothetical protein [Clostridium sp.]